MKNLSVGMFESNLTYSKTDVKQKSRLYTGCSEYLMVIFLSFGAIEAVTIKILLNS